MTQNGTWKALMKPPLSLKFPRVLSRYPA
jgi:hypothetical protein